MSIKHRSLDHGWWYFYRLHEAKTRELTSENFPELYAYLLEVYDDCPDEYFREGPRSSHLKFPLPDLNLDTLDFHEVMELTKQGLEANAKRYKSNHSKVQVHMLEKDNNTLAVEVPLWLHPEEWEQFQKTFKTSNWFWAYFYFRACEFYF